MYKKIIITILSIAVIIGLILFINKNNQNKQPDITEVPSRNDTALIPESEASTTKSYTLAEVGAHNTSTDCWMVIEGKVIDATGFMASGQHPNNKIVNGCGKDATEMFNNVKKHSGSQAKEIMMRSQIGVLE